MSLTLGGKKHLVSIRVLLVKGLLLTIMTINYSIRLLWHWWFALVVNKLKLVAGSCSLKVSLLWPLLLLLILLDAVATSW